MPKMIGNGTSMDGSSKQFDVQKAAQHAIRPAIPPEKFRVFVFGPSLQPDDKVQIPTFPPGDRNQIIEHARYLRYATKVALEKENFTVDFGETRDIFNFWSFSFKGYDTASFELYHARWGCGAIIIYPSSEGSICELSLFSLRDEVSKKTLAIIHEPFRDHNSFFNKAILELFKQINGTSEYINYGNHNQCVAEAVRFVKGKYTAFLRKYQESEDIDRWKSEHARILNS